MTALIRKTLIALLLPLAAADLKSANFYFPDLSEVDKEDYSNWLGNAPNNYTRHDFLPSSTNADDGAAVFWKLSNNTVNFAIAVRATGWVGLGISEAGGMLGADVILFESSSPFQLVDSYILDDKAVPLPDDCQDWSLKNSIVNNGWILIEMSRLLDTGDTQDHPLMPDADLWLPPTRLIAAWGDSESSAYHGGKQGRSSVRLYVTPDDINAIKSESFALEETLTNLSNGNHFDIREDNYEIPAVETEYHDVCKTMEELIEEGSLDMDGKSLITVIGAMPVISEETRQFVHHFTVYLQPDCDQFSFPRSMVYAWAPVRLFLFVTLTMSFAFSSDVAFWFYRAMMVGPCLKISASPCLTQMLEWQ